ncbi:MAG TPA: triose-phosphate isomerase [bacterium]|nr:triose-phosphate isomerase [bacterium]
MTRTPIIAGNWKMYKTVKESVDFVKQLQETLKDVRNCEILVCPTALSVAAVADALRFSNIQVGSQDAHWENEGAYTGNISPAMFKEVGVRYIILGHSERRQYDNDTDKRINAKLKNVLRNGLKAIVCVGETLAEREAGKTEKVVETQVNGCFEGIGLGDLANIVIAYEPVWAIGTGKTATPEQANEVHAFIRKLVAQKYNPEAAGKIRIQYGGSVKPENIKQLMAQPDIDGALVGGASLKVDSFTAIAKF